MTLKGIQDAFISNALPLPNFDDEIYRGTFLFKAKFLGYYFRDEVIDENGDILTEFPCARYEIDPQYRQAYGATFSLLPVQLAPYRKFSIEFTNKIANIMAKNTGSLRNTLEIIANQFQSDSAAINLDPANLKAFRKLLLETGQKISGWKIRAFADLDSILAFINQYPGGLVQMSADYYQSNGGYQKNSHFLVGTAYQFRRHARAP